MIEPPSPTPEPELFPEPPEFRDDFEDDPPAHPWLRQLMKVTYIIVVLLVIAGLIIMFFPWDHVDLPFDPPFRFPERA